MIASVIPDTPGWPRTRPIDTARVHMVGIGGSGMVALAAMLLRRGATVSGTDHVASPALDKLATLGARVRTRQSADAIPPDAELVVASAAIPPEHPELREARRRGLCVLHYAQLLGLLMETRRGLAIAGTHGKSTTTAWLAYTLRLAGLDPSFVVGAECPQLGGGSGVGDGPHFVAEACEYNRSFHHLRPAAAAVLNIDEDHLDCYADIDEIAEAFATFAARIARDGLLVTWADCPRCRRLAQRSGCRVETFGFDPQADWQAREAVCDDGRWRFELHRRDEPLGGVHLSLAGRHNVLNALAVAALATEAGVPRDTLIEALQTFGGACRRLELRGVAAGVTVVDDYAHHPAEIRATLAAARERYTPRRLWCVFQPHQHSRTRFLLEDFARSFERADVVIVPEIYFVRDSEAERRRISAADLVDRITGCGGSAEHIGSFDAIAQRLIGAVQPGDLVITMGAGDIWKLADVLVRRLRS